MTEPRDLIVAFDFEAAGGVPSINGFTQLGGVVMDLRTGEVLATFNEYASMKGYTWEERCVREFWMKFPERFEETKRETEKAELTPHQVVDKFYDWARASCEGHKAFLVTDCCGFDVGLLKAFSSRDILYMFGGLNFVMDTCSLYNGLARVKPTYDSFDGSSSNHAMRAIKETDANAQWPQFPVNHDHHPVNDATVIGLRLVYVASKFN